MSDRFSQVFRWEWIHKFICYSFQFRVCINHDPRWNGSGPPVQRSDVGLGD